MYTCFSDINLRLLENRISLTDLSVRDKFTLLTTEEQNNLNRTNQLKKKKNITYLSGRNFCTLLILYN